MPRFLDRSPFLDESRDIIFRGERVRIRADQIVLWLSLTRKRVDSPDPAAIPFPAILDTGFNYTFAIHDDHLIRWSGLRVESLGRYGTVRDRGERIPLCAANLWCYPNLRGTQDRSEQKEPLQMSAFTGIAVYPGGTFPRLPILGLRAIAENNLILKVDGRRREATLRTPFLGW
jgi:hypothetical protein